MNDQLVVDLARQALAVAALVAGPMLLAALAVGLVVGLLQSLTQIQEQTLAFLPKLLAVATVFLVGLPWILQQLVTYTRGTLQALATLPR